MTNVPCAIRRAETYHHFVQNRPRRVRHLVKLVDAADTAVRQHERSTIHVSHVILKGQAADAGSAHLSSTSCLLSGSRVMYAVKPTADEPLPEVYTPRGAILWTYCYISYRVYDHMALVSSSHLVDTDNKTHRPQPIRESSRKTNASPARFETSKYQDHQPSTH